MKKSKLLGVFCVIAIIAGLLVASCTTEPAPPQVFELTFANLSPAEAPMNRVIRQSWANWLERESEGRIHITLLPSAQAAAPPDHYDAASTGIVDIAEQWLPGVPGRFPLVDVAQLPFVFEFPGSRSAALTLMALYEKYPEIQAQFPDVKVLWFHATDVAHINTVDKPVHTLEDLDGLMQMEWGWYGSATLEALGGNPASIDLTESYDALAKGVVDGTDVSFDGLCVWTWIDVCNYTTEVGTCLEPFVDVMNLDTWNSLPPDLQELFIGENAWNMATIYGYDFDKGDQMFKTMVNETYVSRGYPGVYALPEAEKARWVEAAQPVWEEWISKADAAGAPGRAILEDTLQFAQQYEYDTTPVEWCEDTLHEWGAEGY